MQLNTKKVPEVTDCIRCFTADGLHNAPAIAAIPVAAVINWKSMMTNNWVKYVSPLTGIMLQVTVHHKTDAGVECLVGSLRPLPSGFNGSHPD